MKRDASRSLSFVISLWIALTIAGGMTVYAFFQYAYLPRVGVAEIVAEHLWHVTVLGLVIYALCLALLRRIVVQPLEALRFHLRCVSRGELDNLIIDVKVSELRSIVDSVNGMIRRMKSAKQRVNEERQQRSEAVAQLVEHAQQQVLEIERLSEQLDMEPTAVSIRRVLFGLSKVLANMHQEESSAAGAADRCRAIAGSDLGSAEPAGERWS